MCFLFQAFGKKNFTHKFASKNFLYVSFLSQSGTICNTSWAVNRSCSLFLSVKESSSINMFRQILSRNSVSCFFLRIPTISKSTVTKNRVIHSVPRALTIKKSISSFLSALFCESPPVTPTKSTVGILVRICARRRATIHFSLDQTKRR